jgi:hypothetical protein
MRALHHHGAKLGTLVIDDLNPRIVGNDVGQLQVFQTHGAAFPQMIPEGSA